VAVEGDAAAVARLRKNVRHPRWELQAEPVARAVERLLRLQQQFAVVVLDPPRAGAAEAIAGVARLGAARLVYVSCDPMTLARDVQALMPLGYRARQAWPVDMMPHTSHVEVVCLIEPG
jgi:23S rRNA (uracil1939-C5)-methyltransferase